MKKLLCLLLLASVCVLSSCGLFRTVDSNTSTLPLKTSDAKTSTISPSTDKSGTSVTPTVPATDTQTSPSEPTVISFIGAGDNIVYYGTSRDAESLAVSGGRRYNFKPMYNDVASLIESADIAFINQETLMTGGELSYYPQFNSPQDLAYDLTEIGFDVINIATNHMLDKYDDGLLSTIKFWKTFDGITMIGGYEDENDFNTIRYYEKDGIKIAFLAYTEHTNGIKSNSSSDIVIPYFDEETIKKQISEAKNTADLVIVSAHWGDENTYTPSVFQTHYAQIIADAGADVIIGHHPHAIQKIEWLTGQEYQNKTLCVYSLGNFLSEMANDYNMLGGLITFDISKRGNDTHI